MNCPTCGKTMKGGYLFAPKDGAISFEDAVRFVDTRANKARHLY